MTTLKNCILTHEEINHKIRRIAYQIYEANSDESEVVLAGIDSNGYILAKKIKTNSFCQIILSLQLNLA